MKNASTRWLLLVVIGFACGGHNNGNGTDGGGDDVDAPSGTGDAPTDANGCGLTTCASQNATCGPIGDGCGGILQCGSCPTGETCGGGGVNFQCGGSGGSGSGVCSPQDCADVGANCGIVSDGCGGVTASCGTCPSGQTCGGGSAANVCAGSACTAGLCLQQNSCVSQTPTTIKGTVTAPGHDDTVTWGSADPIYGALVYIPSGKTAGAPKYGVTAFAPGVSCDSCSTEVTGDPMISVTTGVDGKFTINNAPCGTNIPIVFQLGRWRRMVTLANVACCVENDLTNDETHLPRVHTPGVVSAETGSDVYDDIPLMAFDTGSVDTLHCVLRKIGVADSEFVDPASASGGRVRFYKDNGAVIDASTPAASTLYGSGAELSKYDLALFECTGNDDQKKAQASQNNVINFANAGGRVFATHFSYVWMTASTTNTQPTPFSQTATWKIDQGDYDTATAFVDTTLQSDAGTQTRRIAFSAWLQQVGASTTAGQIPVNVVRHDFNGVNPTPATMSGTPAQQWLTTTAASGSFDGPLHYTFDTPVAYSASGGMATSPPTTQCGRVLYSDFHVSDATSAGDTFPAECTNGPMNAQEKTLEFMLFDLASCVGQQVETCTPKTCADLGYNCGESGDGCDDGVILQCGMCTGNQTCGGGGMSGVCGMGPMCTPLTCMEVGAQCGIIGDGCGNTVDCGTCPQGQVCGGNGSANQCGGVIE